jgi:hypothetical protein
VSAQGCKRRGCLRPIRRGHFYCYHCWSDLIERLGDRIERISFSAAEFYIGRTSDPSARGGEHFEDYGRTHLVVLHGSDDIDEICAVEEALIREFRDHPKLMNATDMSLGGGRPDLRNYVYVSWRLKRRFF